MPDLYLIGAPKAGTTSLASWLATHPDVYWSTPKEPYYWAADYPRMREHYGFGSLADYERLFASDAAQRAEVRAEGSTTYLYSAVAVPSILESVPSARFLVCLRNPPDLLMSYHRTQLIALNENEQDFGAAWRRSLEGGQPAADPLDPKLVDYPMVGRLGEAVSRLLGYARREQLHFVIFDDLVAAPRRTWAEALAFVGLDVSHPPDLDRQNASTKTFPSPLLRRAMHRPPPALEAPIARLRQWSRTTSLPGVKALKRRGWKTEPKPVMAPNLRRELAAYYCDDILQLSDLVGRDLSAWSSQVDVDRE